MSLAQYAKLMIIFLISPKPKVKTLPPHTALSFKNSEIIAEKCLFYSEIP